MDLNNKEKKTKKNVFERARRINFFFSSSDKDDRKIDLRKKITMNDPSPDLIKNAQIHQILNEKQLSYDELFHRVDKNNDGKIDVNELIDLLEKFGVETTSQKRAAIAHVSFPMFRFGKGIFGFCIYIAYYW